MPERKDERRIDAGGVQGAGAYVVVRPLTYGEAKAIRQSSPTLTDAQQIALGEALLIDKIAAWNWVDAAGVPLPLPCDDPAVLDRLTVDEMDFLSRAVGGDPNVVGG